MLQRQVPTIQTVQKTVEVLETQHLDGVVNVTVVLQSQVPTTLTVQKTEDIPETQCIGRVADVTVALQRQVPTIQSVQKTMEFPETQCLVWQFNTKCQPSRQYRRRWRFQRLSVLIEWHVRHSCRNAKCQLSHLLIRLSGSEIQNWFTPGSSRNSHNDHVIHGVSMVTEVNRLLQSSRRCASGNGRSLSHAMPTTEGGGRRSNIPSADFHSRRHSCTERAADPFHAEDPEHA